MAKVSDEAITLRRLDYSETSQIMSVFTHRHGQLRLIAKGIKRGTKTRFSPGIDLLEHGRLTVTERALESPGLTALSEWKQLRTYAGLRERLDRLHCALYAAEVTSHLTVEHDPHPVLFERLAGTLDALSVAAETLPILVQFQQSLLQEIGLHPQLDECVSCGREFGGAIAYFSSAAGGILCRDCEVVHVEKRLTPVAAARAIAGGLTGDLPPNFDRAVFDLLNYHIACAMNREPQMAEAVLPAVERRTLSRQGL